MNLTQLGGTSCSDTGALRRRWSWIDHEHHVHAPPIQPLCLTLNPNIEIRIQTQDCIYLTFTSHKCSVRLNVGSRFKVSYNARVIRTGIQTMLQCDLLYHDLVHFTAGSS